MKLSRLATVCLVLACGLATTKATGALGANAGSGLPQPKGRVILSIDGDVAATNAQGRIDFDIAMLEAMPRVSITTDTPWTDGERTYEGVPLKQLLATAGALGNTVKAVGLNAYAVSMPVEQAVEEGAIVAYKADGAYIPARDKGPLWIVFPFDSRPDLRAEHVYERSAWQLRRLTVEE